MLAKFCIILNSDPLSFAGKAMFVHLLEPEGNIIVKKRRRAFESKLAVILRRLNAPWYLHLASHRDPAPAVHGAATPESRGSPVF